MIASILMAVTATVGYDAGNLPKIFVDGKPQYPFIDVCGCSSTGGCGQQWVDDYVAHATATVGPRILQMGLASSDFLRDDGTYDWSILDRKAKATLAILPDAQLMVNIRFVYERWAKAHPEEAIVYGGEPMARPGDEYSGAPVRPSAASEKFRAAVCEAIGSMAEHVKNAPWGEHVVGTRLCYGTMTEWFSYGPAACPDMSEPMNRAFRRYLRGKYRTDAALQKAWRDPAVTLGTATVPPKSVRATPNYLLDPATNRRSADFFACNAEVMADLLLALAKETKRVLPGRLVGAYYGYLLHAIPGEGANFLLDKVLASPDIDFLSDPPDYRGEIRRAGGDFGHKSVVAPFYRYGKVCLLEDDSRMHYVTNFSPLGWCSRSVAEDDAIIRRNVCSTLFDRCGYQPCDPAGGRGTRPHVFDHPNVLAAQRAALDVIGRVKELPEDSGADMALVYDCRSKFFVDTQYKQPGDPAGMRRWHVYSDCPRFLHLSGAAFDVLTLDDLLASKKTYARLVFADLYAPTMAERTALKRLTRRPGVTSVWFIAPGSITDGGFSDAAMSDLVGMDLVGASVNPKVRATDSAAEAFAAAGGGWAKDLPDGAKAVFLPDMPTQQVQMDALMDLIGEHRYVKSGAYVRRHGDYLMLHVGKPGTYRVTLPSRESGRTLTEQFTGRTYGPGSAEVTCDNAETWFFALDAGCDTTMPKGEYERLRQEAVNRPRRILWDDDGCDMSHYPFCRADLAKEPASVRNFELVFLEATERTKVDTVTYSGTYGFGGFTATKAGYFFTNRCAAASDPWRNAAPEFKAMGTDAHRMAIDFAHRNGKEAFFSLRFNDNHDAGGAGDMSSIFITPFKRENRECMMGGDGSAVKCCGWTAMDFAQEKVRAFAKTYIRQFCENYDFDGLLFDFFRHPQLFRTVANGGHATEAELKLMTAFMGELRTMVDEIGRTRGRPFVIGARTPDSPDYCRAIGIDLDGWLDAKAIDFLVVGGYFQLEPWAKSAALAHRHGVRCYASLDETRINERKYRALPGRDSEENWIARAAAAVAQGMDGVFYFNFEYDNHDKQRRVMSVDPAEADGLDKVYFSTHNGAGGYLPRHFLVDGMDYWRMPRIDPGYPTKLAAGGTHAFNFPIGDDFAVWRTKDRTPVLTLKLLTDAKAAADIASFTVNGRTVAFTEFQDGLLTASVPPETFGKGDNAVVIRAGAAVTLHDLSLSITGSGK